MRIEGAHPIPGDPAAVYAMLLDPAILADCIPGCQQLIATGDGAYDMKMKLVLAAVSGEFAGKVALLDQNPPEGYRMRVEGTGKLGFMKGEGVLRLSEAEGGSSIAYEGDVQIGGTFAAVGQRLLDTTARMMIRKFFDKLASHAREPA
mgnify:CR=1 FL=1